MEKQILRFTAQKASRFTGPCNLIILLTFVFFICISQAYAKTGSIIFSKGKISISKDNGATWQVVMDIKKVKIDRGTCIKLDRFASAGLLLPDGSQIRLHGGTLFCVKKIGPTPPKTKGKRGLFKLFQGKMWFRNKRKVPKPQFETPSVVASIRGTELYIEVNRQKELLATLDGIVDISRKQGKFNHTITRGNIAYVDGKKITIEKVIRPEMVAQWLIVVPEIVGPADKNSKDRGIILAKKAIRALEMWNLKEAEDLTKKALQLSPNRAAPHLAYSFIFQAKGQFELALREAIEATKLDPGSIPAKLKVAELLLGLDRISEAKNIIKGLKKSPKNRSERFWSLTYSGYLDLIERNVDGAKEKFLKAIDIAGDSPYCYLGLGLAYWMKNMSQKGIKYMEMASLSAPFWAWPHLYMGKALYELSERHEAEAEIRRAIQLDPNDPTPYIYLSVIYTDLHRPYTAISYLEKALELNNNRLTFRGRFLLDEDRAVTNINLANCLGKLGLYNWADARGNIAIWNSPSSPGAYLFRAVKSIETNEKDGTLLSDARKAELLSPPNSNTYTTYQQYENLLERPRIRKGIFIKGGSDDTYEGTSYISGGIPGLALRLQGSTLGTDGPNKNVPNDIRSGDIRIKKSLSSRSEIFLQSQFYHYKRGNLYSWLDPEASVYPHIHGDFNLNLMGYHQRMGAGSDLLLQGAFIRHKRTEDPDLSQRTLDTKYDGGFGELAWFKRKKSHRFIFGGRWEEYSWDKKTKYHSIYFRDNKDTYSEGERRLEIIDYFEVVPGIFLIGDIGYHYRDIEDIDKKGAEREKIFPGMGIVVNRDKNIFRFAWFESSDLSTFSGTVLPTEIAGFKKVIGPDSGIDRNLIGVGWDRFWNKKIFTRAEIFKRKNYYFRSSFTDGTDSWDREKLYGVKVAIDFMFLDRMGIELETGYKDFYLNNERRRQDIKNNIKFTYVDPCGLRTQLGLLYLVQKKSGSWEDGDTQHIFVPGITIEKYFASNKGIIYIKLLNIFDDEFRYIPENYFDTTQAPWPKFHLEAGLRWEW